MTTEAQYIAQDLQWMDADKLRLLSVLGHELQSIEDLQAKTGFSSEYVESLLQ